MSYKATKGFLFSVSCPFFFTSSWSPDRISMKTVCSHPEYGLRCWQRLQNNIYLCRQGRIQEFWKGGGGGYPHANTKGTMPAAGGPPPEKKKIRVPNKRFPGIWDQNPRSYRYNHEVTDKYYLTVIRMREKCGGGEASCCGSLAPTTLVLQVDSCCCGSLAPTTLVLLLQL